MATYYVTALKTADAGPGQDCIGFENVGTHGEGDTYLLCGDFSWASFDTPVYTENRINFSGDGHVVDILRHPLFAAAGDGSAFSDITIASAAINPARNSGREYNALGAIINEGSDITLRNCHILGGSVRVELFDNDPVDSPDCLDFYVGGLAGILLGNGCVIDGCSNNATVELPGRSARGHSVMMGGIVGYIGCEGYPAEAGRSSVVTNCRNSGDILGSTNIGADGNTVGGIAGSSNARIMNCENSGYINARRSFARNVESYADGIVGGSVKSVTHCRAKSRGFSGTADENLRVPNCSDGLKQVQSLDESLDAYVDPNCAYFNANISTGSTGSTIIPTAPTFFADETTGVSFIDSEGYASLSQVIASLSGMQSGISNLVSLEVNLLQTALDLPGADADNINALNDNVGTLVGKLSQLTDPVACALCCAMNTLRIDCKYSSSGSGDSQPACPICPVTVYCAYIQTLSNVSKAAVAGQQYTLTPAASGPDPLTTDERGMIHLTNLAPNTDYTLAAQPSPLWKAAGPWQVHVNAYGVITVEDSDGAPSSALAIYREADPDALAEVRDMEEGSDSHA
ncbi:hypothetical protein AGMMS49992_02910 [Clostridia bacterium]|nr:hypothetical protein AGMMS49992_02910 [Clostridia bacterium]